MEQEEIKLHIIKILESELLLVLATSHQDRPWACVLEFVHDKDLNLYWRSDQVSRHSQNISSNPNIAGTVTLPITSTREGIGLQFFGTVTTVPTAKHVQLAEKLEMKRSKDISLSIQNQESDRTWYKLSIKKCYLLHEPLLGYDRVEYLFDKATSTN